MPRQFQHPLAGYGAALLLQCLATGLGLLLIQVFANLALPAVPMILVIVLIGIFWGAAPSLLAVIIGVLLFSFVIISPRFTLIIPRLSDVWEFGLLILLGFLLALAASQRERSRRRTEELLTLLEQAQALAFSERLRLRQVLEVLPAGVTITDGQSLILEMNATMHALWELETPPVGQSIRTLAKSWCPAADRSTPAQQGALARALGAGETAPGREMEIETHSGQHKTILHSAAPIRDES